MNKEPMGANKGLRGLLIHRPFLAVALLSLVFLFLIFREVEKGILMEHSERLVTMAENLAANSEYGFITADRAVLENLLEGVKRQKDVLYASVVETTEGKEKVLVEYAIPGFVPPPFGPSKRWREAVRHVNRLKEEMSEMVIPVEIVRRPANEEHFFTGSEDSSSEKRVKAQSGYVRVCISMKEEFRNLQRLILKLFMLLAVAIILSATYFYRILTREVIEPVTDFIRGTEAVGRGELDYRVAVRSESEIGKLAKAFNLAVEKRKEAAQEVVRHRDHLEELVGERTSQLEESEERFKKLADSTYEGIIVHDEGVILDANNQAAKMYGYRIAELIGKNGMELLVHPDYLEIARKNLASMSEETYEIHQVRKDGTTFPVEIRGRAILYKGRTVRVLAIRDISDHKMMEEMLKKAKETAENATKLKDKFISLVSHDLRSPIASLIQLLRNIESEKEIMENARMKRLFGLCEANSERILQMIDELLNISRLQSGRMRLAPEVMDLRKLVQFSVVSLLPVAEAKGISVSNDVPSGTRIVVDRTLFLQVVQNLVSNSIKFCKAGDRVAVSSAEGKETIITVRDTGVGIPEQLLSNLFRTEVKTSTLGTGGEKGTGLGLSLCKEIVEVHGGTIRIESALGVGTAIHIILPHAKPLALVVDANTASRGALARELQARHIETMEASDGEEALAIMNRAMPHVIVSELELPMMDGLIFIRKAKTVASSVPAPIIVYSESTDREKLRKVMELGITEFIPKSSPPSEVAQKVETLW